MKKLIFTVLTVLISFSAWANFAGVTQVMGPGKFELKRPLFDKYYSTLHNLANENNVEAYYESALRYYYGYVKRLDINYNKDYKAAALWFYEAAIKGHAMAAYFLGNMYLYGQGVEPNYKTSIWWFSMAHKKGIDDATLMLGNVYYYMGKDKRLYDFERQNYIKQAESYYQLLINKNSSRASYNLALLKLREYKLDRFIIAECNQLLMQSLNKFIIENDKTSIYEIIKVMGYYKMPDRKYAEELFNRM